MRHLTSFFLALVVSVVSFGKVIEAPSMREAVSTVDSETLVIFDLDNTVMMPSQTLGGEEWYDYLVEKYAVALVKEGKSETEAKREAIQVALRQWNEVQRVTDMVPVEKDTPSLIKAKQVLGAKTMALTARPVELLERTKFQLKSIGIDFGLAAPHPTAVDIQGKGPARFDQGVLVVGPENNKGQILIQFIEKLKVKPTRIVFVDNKRHHVENVERELAGKGIDYLGCRHGAADAKIASFNKAVADIQFRYFGKILDDSAARVLLENTPE